MPRKRGRQPRFSEQSYLGLATARPAEPDRRHILAALLALLAGGPGLVLVVAVPGRSSVSEDTLLT